MVGRLRLFAYLLAVPALMLAIGLGAAAADTADGCGSLPPNLGSGHIAFADPEFQIHVVRPSGCFPTRISQAGGVFAWPIWSPDGSRVAYAGQRLLGGVPGPLELWMRTLGAPSATNLFTSQLGMGPILPGMPYYPLWSPDGTTVSLMASAPGGLTLYVIRPAVEDGIEAAVVGSPLYADWSADSSRMLLHVGLDHLLVDVEGGLKVQDLGFRSIGYRAPSWWPSGSRAAVLALDESGTDVLAILDTDTLESIPIGETGAETAFLWSPNGRMLAVAESDVAGNLVYGDVSFYSADGAELPLRIAERVVAFFWSPDSTKLAYITVTQPPNALRWMVLDVTTGGSWPLVDFTPSSQQFQLFRFFDQFALSHSAWSPDSRSLVFAGTLVSQTSQASVRQQQAPRIMVTGVEPSPEVRPIADGGLGVWSPR